jgi:hypothetical protein
MFDEPMFAALENVRSGTNARAQDPVLTGGPGADRHQGVLI